MLAGTIVNEIFQAGKRNLQKLKTINILECDLSVRLDAVLIPIASGIASFSVLAFATKFDLRGHISLALVNIIISLKRSR